MKRTNTVTTALLAALVALILAGTNGVFATHAPADKVVASGSTLEVTDAASQPVELLSATLKSSAPSDLMLQVTAECALWTDVSVTGNDSSTAIARVELWLEMDGEVIPVSSDDVATGDSGAPLEAGQAEAGHVVFCNRAYQLVTAQFDDEDAMISIYNRTRSANAFNWLTLNVGSGTHTIKVFADLVTDYTDNALAKAAVGKRTLIIEPAKLANDAQI